MRAQPGTGVIEVKSADPHRLPRAVVSIDGMPERLIQVKKYEWLSPPLCQEFEQPQTTLRTCLRTWASTLNCGMVAKGPMIPKRMVSKHEWRRGDFPHGGFGRPPHFSHAWWRRIWMSPSSSVFGCCSVRPCAGWTRRRRRVCFSVVYRVSSSGCTRSSRISSIDCSSNASRSSWYLRIFDVKQWLKNLFPARMNHSERSASHGYGSVIPPTTPEEDTWQYRCNRIEIARIFTLLNRKWWS